MIWLTRREMAGVAGAFYNVVAQGASSVVLPSSSTG